MDNIKHDKGDTFGWSTDEAGCIVRTDRTGGSYKGRITNCIIELREDQKGPMFTSCNDEVSFNLDKYAIIPVEKYRDMQKRLGKFNLWRWLKKRLGI
jgi:hypothetical protein